MKKIRKTQLQVLVLNVEGKWLNSVRRTEC